MGTSAVANGVLGGGDDTGLLSKERIIAAPGFSRWLVPPAALACPVRGQSGNQAGKLSFTVSARSV